MSEIKYTILKKGQKLRAYRLNSALAIESQIMSFMNLESDVKIEFSQFGSETALSIYAGANIILIYCQRFEIKEGKQ